MSGEPAGVKYTTGKPSKKLPTGAPGVMWHRIRDNWTDMKRLAVNPDFGTVVGRMFMFEILTARQASACRLYAEVTGRYDRYHPNRGTELRRTAASPAYARTSRGKDDEIERRERDGTLREWTRHAKRAKRAYAKLDGCIPNDTARTALDEVCIHDREINSAQHPDLCRLLDKIAERFQFGWEYD